MLMETLSGSVILGVSQNTMNRTVATLVQWGPAIGGTASTEPPTTTGNESDFDVTDYLTSRLGWRHRTQAESVALTLAYCLILLTGVIGNLATCAVIVKNTTMHTATNFYLFSLAVSDTMALVLGLPPELYGIWEAYPWPFGEPYCLFKTFLTEVMSTASILTITAFTIERYVAICHPLRAQVMSSLSRAVRIILLIWAVASITALPYPLHTRTYYYVYDPLTRLPIADSLVCNIPLHWMPKMRYIFQLSTLFLFVLPMSLMTFLYLRIWVKVHKSRMASHSFDSSGSLPGRGALSSSRRAVLRILVAVLVMFFICWAPFHIQRIMTVCIPDDQWTSTMIELQSNLFYISGVLYYVSSTVNPILYNLMSYKYRQAFRDTLCLASDARTLVASRRKMTIRSRQSRFSETSLQVPLSLGGPGTSQNPVGLLWTAASLRRMSCVKAGEWKQRKGSSSGSGMSRGVNYETGWRRCLRERLEMAWKRKQLTWRSESGRSDASSEGELQFRGNGLFPVIARKSTAVTEVDEVSDASERMMSCSPTSMAAFLREELLQARDPQQVATPRAREDAEDVNDGEEKEEDEKAIDHE